MEASSCWGTRRDPAVRREEREREESGTGTGHSFGLGLQPRDAMMTCRRLDLRWGGGGSANSSMTRNPPPLRGRECSRAKREDFAAMRLGSMLSCMTVRRGLGDFKFSEVSGRALRSAPPQPSPNFFRGDSLSSVECGKTAASAGSEQELSSELDAVRQSHDLQWRF
jgi:hypothetical protein